MSRLTDRIDLTEFRQITLSQANSAFMQGKTIFYFEANDSYRFMSHANIQDNQGKQFKDVLLKGKKFNYFIRKIYG